MTYRCMLTLHVLWGWYLITGVNTIVKLAGGAVGLTVAIILWIIGVTLHSNTILASAGMLFGSTAMIVVGYVLKLIFCVFTLCWSEMSH